MKLHSLIWTLQRVPVLGRVVFPAVPALLLLLAVPPNLTRAADSGTGTVVGTVIDDVQGRYLEGAEVRVEGTSIRATTERGGRFVLSGVPAGGRTLSYYYPDLEPKTQVVQVQSGGTTTVENVRLAPAADVVVLGEFTVETSREGMSQAIALQKASFNQKLVAAGDQFGNISEGNVGEYLKFLPGVGIDYTANDARAVSLRGLNPVFTNVTVDGGRIASGTSSGDSRRFELEQVAINNVETIEVFKTMTPDMAADNTGGQVNLVTKSAFDREAKTQFTYNMSLTGNADNLTWSKRGAWGNEKQRLIRPNLDLNYSRRFGDKVGMNISYRLSEVTHDYPRLGYSWNFSANGATPTNPYLTRLQMYDEQKITHREALSSKLDYMLTPLTKLTLTGQWNWYDLTFAGRSINYNTGTPAAGFTPNTVRSTPGSGTVSTDVSQRNKYGPTYMLAGQFTHEFDKGKLWGGYSWSKAENKYRDTTQGYYTGVNLNLIRPTGHNTVVAFDDLLTERLPMPTVTQASGTPDLRDLSSYTIAADQWRTRPYTSTETKIGYDLGYRHKLELAIPVAVQVGVRRDELEREIQRIGVRVNHPALTGSQLEPYRDDLYSTEDIGFGFGAFEWLSPYKVLEAFPNLTADNFSEDVYRFIEEDNDAAYLRLDLDLTEKFSVVTGARYETRDLKATARDFRQTLQRETTAALKYDGWYPSLNVKYLPSPDWVVRFGVSRTIGHPDYSDIIPTVTDYDPSSATSNGSISIPNPNIDPYKITNFDLTGEYYLRPSGVLSASIFWKKVKGFISRGTVGFLNTLPNASQIGQEYGIAPADFPRYEVEFADNGADSEVRGLELSYSQSLSFLPKPFDGFNVQLNFTYVEVSGDDFEVELAQLQNATTRSANAIIGYKWRKFSILTTVNYTGDVETGFGTSATSPATFTEAVTKTDVTLNYAFSEKATAFLQIRNIFGEGKTEFQTPSDPGLFKQFNVPSRYSEYGDPIFYLGVKGRF